MSDHTDSLRAPLKRVRHLGSAKNGTGHWLAQRISAIALIPLSLWFISTLLKLVTDASPERIAEFFAEPLPALATLLFIGTLFYHSWLGLQVVIEDYVHGAFTRNTLLLLSLFANLGLGILSAMAVLKLHFLFNSGV